MSAILSVRDLTMRFGGLVAVNSVSFEVQPDKITALIGPNGAGKTTLFNCVTGFYRPTAGSIRLNGGRPVELSRLPGHRIAHLGVARTFQNIRLFPKITVLENLLVAQHTVLMRASVFSIAGLLGLPSYRRAERAALDKARYWLNRIGLLDRANDPADTLPYGQQRRLEIVRALCTEPRLLCLDEPAAGLNPRESADLADFIRQVQDERDLAVLLIEHDMSVVMGISDHIAVLDYGRKIAEGTPAEIRANPAVIAAYLWDGGLMLRLENISASYGAVRALDNVSIDVAEGEIVTLIGANGAGKSTLLMTICGNPHAESGKVWLKGRDITALPTHQIAALGIAHAPEGRRIFARMTVRENLQLGARLRDPARFGANLDSVVALFPRLKERLDQRGGTLSGGEQQMLAIGRALMAEPQLLLLDEPSLGIAPLLVQQIFAAVGQINRERGMSILIVEQNAHHALRLAHRGYVLVTGSVTLQGPAADLAANPDVQAAYLGG